jgi:cytolysin (calcineurin-like family phosphatase)
MNEEHLITEWLNPTHSAGQNQFGAKTNADWLKRERLRIMSHGKIVYIIEHEGQQALSTEKQP